jgi:tetratricopeptide (TPR) repeat protein
MVAQLRGNLDTAENWYQQALTINEQLANRPPMAGAYHQLGIIAQDRGDFDTAENWYQQALTIKEELGNRPSIALTYGQLGLLAEARGGTAAALAWVIRCVILFDAFPHPATGPAPRHLARLTAILGWETFHREWQNTTGQPPPPEVIDYIKRLLEGPSA